MLLATLFAAALLHQEVGETPDIECVRAGNTIQMNACVAEDLAKEQARMQLYFDAAMRRAFESDAESARYGDEPSHQTAWLEASQSSWEAYAETRCAGVWDNWKAGTIRTMMSVGCRIAATRQRTHDIWEDYLTYVDSTPAVLPEPIMSVREEEQAAEAR